MAKTKKPKSPKKPARKTKPATGPSWPARLAARCAHALTSRPKAILLTVTLAAIVVAAAAGTSAMRRVVHARQHAHGATRYIVSLRSAPSWAPRGLLRMVSADMLPTDPVAFEDDDLCRIIHDRAVASPWVREVHCVRRERVGPHAGRVVVDATLRRAVARVRYNGRNIYVSQDGVVLPAAEVPQWAVRLPGRIAYFLSDEAVAFDTDAVPVHYIVIDGVRTRPPACGQVWQAADLMAGLKLIELVSDRPYANQITVVDVRNHGQRVNDIDPELRFHAQHGRSRSTTIKFGRFPNPHGGDWVVSPERKMHHLDQYVAMTDGRLAGLNEYIDVRRDELEVSPN